MRTDIVLEGELGGANLKVLTTLVQFSPMRLTKSQLAINSGYRQTSGHFKNTLSQLFKRGYLARDNNGELWATDTGLRYFGKSRPEPKTKEEVIQIWRGVLPKVALAAFDFMLSYNSSVSKEFIASSIGYSATSGHFKNNMSTLTKNKLIKREGDKYFINPDLGMM